MKYTIEELGFILYNNRSVNGVVKNFLPTDINPLKIIRIEKILDKVKENFSSDNRMVEVNIKELNCQFSNDQSSFKYELIQNLYQLEKLDTTYFRAANFNAVKMKSNSLKELYIQAHNEGTFTSLEGINNMPNLEKLTVIGASALTNIPTVLKSYKHKINYIKIQSCAQVNVVELQTYCQTNNIKLEISEIYSALIKK